MKEKEYSKSHRHNQSKTEGLSPRMKRFTKDLNRLLDNKGLSDQLYITDGKRDPNAGYGSKTSRHHHGDAIDIRPSAEIYKTLVNTKEGVKLMMDYGVGIYDETDPRNMKVATGKHFHIGNDSAFVEQTKERWRYFNENPDAQVHQQEEKAFIESHPEFDYNAFVNERNKAGVTGTDKFNEWAEGQMTAYENYMQPYQFTPEKFKIYSGVGAAPLTPSQSVKKQTKTEEKKEEKKEENEGIKKVIEDQKKRQAFMEQLGSLNYNVKRKKSKPTQQQGVQFQKNPIPQNQMANLPSIWTFPEQYQMGGEIKYSELGYKKDSPDKDNPFNIINSNKITMKDVPHKVLGIDDLGNRQIMEPGGEYTFKGSQVLEIPLKNNRTKRYR